MGNSEETGISIEHANILQYIRASAIADFPDIKWKELIDEQEYQSFIIGIREELMGRVNDYIDTEHHKDAQIKFLIECSYEAWLEVLRMNFMFHESTDEYYEQNSSWLPDSPPEPCAPDSWSKGNISVKASSKVNEQPLKTPKSVQSDFVMIKLKDYPTDVYKSEVTVTALSEQTSQETLTQLSKLEAEDSLSFNMHITTPAMNENLSLDELVITKSSKSVFEAPFCKRRVIRRGSTFSENEPSLKLSPIRTIEPFNFDFEDPSEVTRKLNLLPPLRMNVLSYLVGVLKNQDAGKGLNNNKHGYRRKLSFDQRLIRTISSLTTGHSQFDSH